MAETTLKLVYITPALYMAGGVERGRERQPPVLSFV